MYNFNFISFQSRWEYLLCGVWDIICSEILHNANIGFGTVSNETEWNNTESPIYQVIERNKSPYLHKLERYVQQRAHWKFRQIAWAQLTKYTKLNILCVNVTLSTAALNYFT